jgi:YD repeat-containing protein
MTRGDQLLTAPLKNASTNALIKQYTYGYDLASNRTSELVATTTTTSTPNNVNEIVSQSGGTNRTLTYDLNGSITSDGGTRTFEWDGANRLVAINYTRTNDRSEFTYDGLNRLGKIVEKSGTRVNSTRRFVWCGTEICEFRDANDSLVGCYNYDVTQDRQLSSAARAATSNDWELNNPVGRAGEHPPSRTGLRRNPALNENGVHSQKKGRDFTRPFVLSRKRLLTSSSFNAL